MKFTTAVALGFGAEALADSTYTWGSGFGTCTSSTCYSATSGLSAGVNAGESSWNADPTKSATYTSTSWGTWSADPTKTSTSSTTWGTWSADPKSSSTSTTWSTWSADPTKASSSSTAW